MKGVRENQGHSERRGEVNHDQIDASRREILAKIGRFAYVAPALALLAEPKSVQAYGTRPGYGYGDPNHDHTGPPGQNNQ